MLLTSTTTPVTEPLTLFSSEKLRSCDRVRRSTEDGLHCATGYRQGRVHVVIQADSASDLDAALGVGEEDQWGRTGRLGALWGVE